ncbi:MAG: MBL fold hydrolase [Rhodobacteraceae bacterium]|nr:MAG: MBL fold hydrolase [Paracoccaceae bacterium]
MIHFPHAEPPVEGEAIEVAEGVLWMRLPLPMRLDHVNVYALDDGDSWTVIDTGFNSKRGQAIWEKLMAGPLQGKPISRVLVTHHHPDHVGMAGWLQSDHGAELWTTRTAWLFSRMLTLDVQSVWPEETLAFYRAAGMDGAFYDKRKAERPFNFSDVVAPMPLGFQRIKQDDILTIGGRRWVVHVGHGHAPEHATLWSLDDDLVISGDQIIAGISSNLGVYATEPEADPVGDWLESCERLGTMAQERHFVLPGHKLPFSGLPHRMTQLIENHHSALIRLEKHLETPQTAAECFAPLFKRAIGDGEYGLALVEAYGHLNHLHQGGKIRRKRRADDAWLWQKI